MFKFERRGERVMSKVNVCAIGFVLMLNIANPFVAIAAVNTLFGAHIAYTGLNWLAMWWIIALLPASKRVSKRAEESMK
jgi:hypothetical protein